MTFARVVRGDILFQLLGNGESIEPERKFLGEALDDLQMGRYVYELLKIRYELLELSSLFPVDVNEKIEMLLMELVEVSNKLDPSREFLIPEHILNHFFYSLDEIEQRTISNLFYEIFTGISLENISAPEEISEISFAISTPNIFTLTANSALAFTIDIRSLPAKRFQIHLGGGGLNISQMLKNMGVLSIPFGFLGGNIGKLGAKLLYEAQIPVNYMVSIGDEVRQATIVYDVDPQQIWLMTRDPEIKISEQNKLLTTMFQSMKQGDILVISGSIPHSLPLDFCEQIITEAKKRGIIVLLDSKNKPFWKGVKAGPFVITPNLKEFADLRGKHLKELEGNIEFIIREAQAVIRDTGTEVIIVKLGFKGAILVTKDIVLHAHYPIIDPEDVQSTVACGDCLMAGFVYAYFIQKSTLKDLKEALRFGIAAGTAKVFLSMHTLPNLEGISKILPDVIIEELDIMP